MMEPSPPMRSALFVILYLLATSILCHQMEPEDIINTIETVGITTGNVVHFDEVHEWINRAEREKRQDPNRLQNVNVNCKKTVESLTTAFRRKIANVPQPVRIDQAI